jgi:hypothetical protein
MCGVDWIVVLGLGFFLLPSVGFGTAVLFGFAF